MTDKQVPESEKLAATGQPEGEHLLAKEAAVALNPPVDTRALHGSLTKTLLLSVAGAAGGSSFIFGYNIGAINVPHDVIRDWTMNVSYPKIHGEPLSESHWTNVVWPWVVSIFALGGVFGGLLCGIAADKFGRKGAMLLNNVFCFAGAALMGFAKSADAYPMLIVGRFVIGFNCGLNSGLAPMYLTEIAPVNYRGLLGSVNQLMVTVSILVANIIGLPQVLGTAELWPLVLAFTIVPAIWQIAIFLTPLCPESPKYLLIVKNQRENAEKALKALRNKEDVSAELKAMQDEADKIASAPKVKFGDMFRHPILRWALIIAVMMMLAQQFSGINAAMYYSGVIFKEKAKLEGGALIGAVMAVMIINVVMTIVSTAMVDRFGRRILMLIGMAGMWITGILISVCLYMIQQDEAKYDLAKYFAIVFVVLFVVSFATGPGSIPWFYVSELFDQGARGHANAVAVMTNWLANFIVGMTFLPWQRAVQSFSFMLFTGLLTIFWLFTFFFAPETKGRQLEDIQEELRRKAPGAKRGST